MNALQGLVQYSNWANKTWLDFVLGNASDDAYLRKMISHIYLAEQVWFQRIYGEEVRSDVFSTLEPDEFPVMQQRHVLRYDEQLHSDLGRVIAYRRFNGEPLESTVEDILNHLITHGAHHRGQMASHASKQGLAPSDTSYISYTRAKIG